MRESCGGVPSSRVIIAMSKFVFSLSIAAYFSAVGILAIMADVILTTASAPNNHNSRLLWRRTIIALFIAMNKFVFSLSIAAHSSAVGILAIMADVILTTASAPNIPYSLKGILQARSSLHLNRDNPEKERLLRCVPSSHCSPP